MSLTLQLLGTYLGMPLGSVAAARLYPAGPAPLVRVAIALFVAYYAALVLFAPRAAALPLLLGGLGGVANGVYWFATNALTYDLVPPDERSAFYGANGALAGLVGIAMPVLAGEAIVRLGHGVGYPAVFAAALVLYAAAAVATRSLPEGHAIGATDLSAPWRLLGRSPRWRAAWSGTAAASG